MGETNERGRRRGGKLVGIVLIGLIVVIGVLNFPVVHPLFPERAEVGCTVTGPAEERSGGRPRDRDLSPERATDCGPFTMHKEVTCSADPSRSVQFVEGVRYDFTVRGPRIPFLSAPTVFSAQLSAEQPPRAPLFDDGEELPLVQQFSPENLRAWDYEQPPFDVQCDSMRYVMTTEGLLLMDRDRAEAALDIPSSVVPVTPLRPCVGIRCTHTF